MSAPVRSPRKAPPRPSFARECVEVAIADLIPLKTVRPALRRCKRYDQIRSSIKAVGLVEPPVVCPATEPGRYYIVDGLVRVEALKELGFSRVECIVSSQDDTYTYNKHINRLPPVQEHRMLVRATKRGVPAERIAEALGLSLTTIRKRLQMMHGVCPEAAELLADRQVPLGVFRVLRQMKPMRQIEAAELMLAQANISIRFAWALLAATGPEQLVPDANHKQVQKDSVTQEMARLERELASLREQTRTVDEVYGPDVLQLTIARTYLRSMLGSAAIVKWLLANRREYLLEFQKIAEMPSLAAATAKANPGAKGPRPSGRSATPRSPPA